MAIPGGVAEGINTMWALVVAFLIFFMQPGFALLESGQVRAKNVGNVLMKNMTDWTAGVLAFFLIGNGLSATVGALTAGSAVGTPFAYFGAPEQWVTWLVGAVFAMTAATIVSGAVAERMNFTAYAFVAVLMTAVVYPITTGMTWSGGLLAVNPDGPNGYIARVVGAGYLDFAGATVVHMLGGIAGLVGAWMVGPREGRFDASGDSHPIPGHSMLLAVLGTLILAFGWYGFNVGTSSIFGPDNTLLSAQLGRVALNTTLGMGAGAVAAMVVSASRQGKPDPLWTANGLLAGLVAVTGAVPHVTWVGGIVLGGLGGALVLPTYRFVVDSLHVDDVCGVFAVHGMAGAVGTLLIPFFATSGFSTTQLVMQVVGVGVVAAWAFVGSGLTFWLADLLFGLRVSPEEEEAGLDASEHGVAAYPEFTGGGSPDSQPVSADGGYPGGEGDD